MATTAASNPPRAALVTDTHATRNAMLRRGALAAPGRTASVIGESVALPAHGAYELRPELLADAPDQHLEAGRRGRIVVPPDPLEQVAPRDDAAGRGGEGLEDRPFAGGDRRLATVDEGAARAEVELDRPPLEEGWARHAGPAQ